MDTNVINPLTRDAAAAAPILSIIITSYNTREVVRDCLNSIYGNPPSEPFEIILVDDASADGTSEMVSAAFPQVRLLRNETNRNYSYSNNRGLDQAVGQFVLLLNNDTIVPAGSLDRMVAFLRDHPDAGVVGCKLLNEDGSTQWSVKALPGPGAALFGARSLAARLFPNNPFTRRHLLHVDEDTAKPFQAGLVSGAASMSPLAVMRKVGRLDDQFFYHVDADYCKRVAETGYKCYYLPSASIIHLNHKGGTMASLPRRFRSLWKFETDSYRYYRKHTQASRWSPMNLFVAAGLSCHFVGSALGQVCTEIAAAIRPPHQSSVSVGVRANDD
jgi:GT2 family glycosyltransferase